MDATCWPVGAMYDATYLVVSTCVSVRGQMGQLSVLLTTLPSYFFPGLCGFSPFLKLCLSDNFSKGKMRIEAIERFISDLYISNENRLGFE